MSRVVSTEVTLTTGEKVKVYYINEAFRRELEFLLDSEIRTIFTRLNEIPFHLEDRLRFLEEILTSSIYGKLFLEIREAVMKKDPSKSFRKHELIHSIKTPYYWDLKETAFQNLLKAGLITSRGGSWFRRGSK